MFMTSLSILVAPDVPRDVTLRSKGDGLRAEENNVCYVFCTKKEASFVLKLAFVFPNVGEMILI